MTERAMRVAGFAGLCLATGVAVAEGRARRWDERAFRAVNRDLGPTVDGFIVGLTDLGAIWASAAGAAVLGMSGRRQAAMRGLAAASTAWIAGQALKKLFLRPRPYEADGDVRLLALPPAGTSWPSSHPAVILAFLLVAARELGLSPVARRALAGLGAAVGFSRTYIGVHYPGDVVGGLLMGRAVADALSADPD